MSCSRPTVTVRNERQMSSCPIPADQSRHGERPRHGEHRPAITVWPNRLLHLERRLLLVMPNDAQQPRTRSKSTSSSTMTRNIGGSRHPWPKSPLRFSRGLPRAQVIQSSSISWGYRAVRSQLGHDGCHAVQVASRHLPHVRADHSPVSKATRHPIPAPGSSRVIRLECRLGPDMPAVQPRGELTSGSLA
jgi:hypothetical protein